MMTFTSLVGVFYGQTKKTGAKLVSYNSVNSEVQKSKSKFSAIFVAGFLKDSPLAFSVCFEVLGGDDV